MPGPPGPKGDKGDLGTMNTKLEQLPPAGYLKDYEGISDRFDTSIQYIPGPPGKPLSYYIYIFCFH